MRSKPSVQRPQWAAGRTLIILFSPLVVTTTIAPLAVAIRVVVNRTLHPPNPNQNFDKTPSTNNNTPTTHQEHIRNTSGKPTHTPCQQSRIRWFALSSLPHDRCKIIMRVEENLWKSKEIERGRTVEKCLMRISRLTPRTKFQQTAGRDLYFL